MTESVKTDFQAQPASKLTKRKQVKIAVSIISEFPRPFKLLILPNSAQIVLKPTRAAIIIVLVRDV